MWCTVMRGLLGKSRGPCDRAWDEPCDRGEASPIGCTYVLLQRGHLLLRLHQFELQIIYLPVGISCKHSNRSLNNAHIMLHIICSSASCQTLLLPFAIESFSQCFYPKWLTVCSYTGHSWAGSGEDNLLRQQTSWDQSQGGRGVVLSYNTILPKSFPG